jgi:hypothetical protein
MTRMVCVALLSILIAVPASAETAAAPNSWRIREIPIATAETQLPAIDLGSYGRIGVGVFGLKPDVARSRAVLVREVTTPRHRRAGVGFSMKF